jgi:hypothetical protein
VHPACEWMLALAQTSVQCEQRTAGFEAAADIQQDARRVLVTQMMEQGVHHDEVGLAKFF